MKLIFHQRYSTSTSSTNYVQGNKYGTYSFDICGRLFSQYGLSNRISFGYVDNQSAADYFCRLPDNHASDKAKIKR